MSAITRLPRLNQPLARAASPRMTEAQPERAPGRPVGVAQPQPHLVRPLPRLQPALVATHEVRSHRQPLEVLGVERPTCGGGHKAVVDVRPRPLLERSTSLVVLAGHVTQSGAATRYAFQGGGPAGALNW
ncbi:MAG: hypothetical protein ACRDY6_08680 [Acidimicrobiia bacterium]